MYYMLLSKGKNHMVGEGILEQFRKDMSGFE